MYIRSLVWHTVLHLNFILQGTYVTTVTASDGDTMLNAPVEYFIDTGSLNKTKKKKKQQGKNEQIKKKLRVVLNLA